MKDGICVRRIRVERLPKEQAGLSVRITAAPDETDVRAKRQVSGRALPHVVKRIVRKPHVRAAAGDGIGSAAGVVLRNAGFADLSDIAVAFEKSQSGGFRLSVRNRARKDKDEDRQREEVGCFHGWLVIVGWQ